MEEIWKDIEGYEGYYQVSNLGRVRSVDRYVKHWQGGISLFKGKIITGNDRTRKYKKVQLSKDGVSKGYYIHRLVAITFLPNPNNYPVINHKDEDPSNNCVENLEWCTQKHNMNWKGVMKRKVGKKLRKSEEEKKYNRKLYVEKNRDKIRERQHNYHIEHYKKMGKVLRSILQYDKNGFFIAEYESAEDAKRKTGISHINCVCNGHRKTAGGFIWKWGKEYLSK